jgi:hypothetical protein
MDTEMNRVAEKQADECGGCSCCSLGAGADAGNIKGIKLIICAFLVFVAPLIAAAVGAGFAQHYHPESKGWTIGAAVLAAGVTIFLVRFITRRLGTAAKEIQPRNCLKNN